MTLKQQFLTFLIAVYPDPPIEDSEQYRQLKQAFYGGCLVAYTSQVDYTKELLEVGNRMANGEPI